MPTAIDVEQLTEARARLAPTAMPPARPMLLYQAGRLQGLFEEAVGDGDAVLARGHLMKVPHIESPIPLPIEAQQPLDFRRRDPPNRGRMPPFVDQPDV